MLTQLRQKSESYRQKAALAVTTFLFLAIFVSWASYNGLLRTSPQTKQPNVAAVEVASKSKTKAASPVESASSTFNATMQQIKKQYSSLKESVSAVFVPFITGIEVYQSEK